MTDETPEPDDGRDPLAPGAPGAAEPHIVHLDDYTHDAEDRDAEHRDEHRDGPASVARQLIEIVITVAAAYLLAQVLRAYVIEPYVVPTGSMIPTIELQDQVLVNKFLFHFRPPQRGDIVVLEDPTHETPALIKRVIAVGGQTVDVRDGAVWVDGVKLVEPYTYGQPTEPGPYPLPVKLPAETVWVMGDNRTQSKDARWFGPQPLSAVRGPAFMVYWPPARIHLF